MSVNFESLKAILNSGDKESLGFYKKTNRIGKSFRKEELQQTASLTEKQPELIKYIKLDNLFLGVKVDRINQENDILKFFENAVIDIELKSAKRPDTKSRVIKTLRRTKFYTRTLKKEFVGFAYFSETNELFHFDGNQLIEVDWKSLPDLGEEINHNELLDIDESTFIFSPLDNIQRFQSDDYLLTEQQEKLSNEIQSGRSLGISGKAGVGKSLVLYDAAKRIKQNNPDKNIAIIFSRGTLRPEHGAWSKMFNIDIFPAKLNDIELVSYDIVLVDESQRLFNGTRDKIMDCYKNGEIQQLVMFFDPEYQFFSKYESGVTIQPKLKDYLDIHTERLSESVRSDSNLIFFVNGLFNLGHKKEIVNPERIDVQFFSDYITANSWLQHKEGEGFRVVNPMKDKYQSNEINSYLEKDLDGKQCVNSYDVIGSDIDNVAVIIDSRLYYDQDGILHSYPYNYYYDGLNQLYVNLTRAKEKIAIAVVHNNDVFNAINLLLNFVEVPKKD
ncbi:DUF2075 domain-containing protein [Lactobacillaceae bacterium L1_55_11]|nr:DUF2075 domain-containing protein [Lactobacillaceae bacterium L1_55_11]